MIQQFLNTCEKFFSLIETQNGGNQTRLQTLFHTLVELNYLCHKLEESEHSNVKINHSLKSFEVFRSQISKSFPEIGFYWYCLNPNEMNKEPEFGTGDAIDDIFDIYTELEKGYSLFQNGNLKEAISYWKESYQSHWGEHLIQLQNYLYSILPTSA